MSWAKVKLGDIAMMYNGGTPDRANDAFYAGDIPWITGADLRDGEVNGVRLYITEDALRSSATRLMPKGSLLFVSRTGVGKVAIAPFGVCISQDFTGIVPDGNRIDIRYLLHYIKASKTYFTDRARGATIQGVTRDVVAKFEIPLPPLLMQQRIAAVLDEVDALRQKRERTTERLSTLLDGHFRTVVGDPLTGHYHFPVKNGKEVYKLASGKFFKREDHSSSAIIPAYGGSGIAGWADYANVEAPTIVIGRVGFHCGNVNLLEKPSYITDNAIYIRELDKEFNIDFIYHFLRLSQLNRFRDPGDLKKITQKPLDQLQIPSPSLFEQLKIVESLNSIKNALSEAQASEQRFSSLAFALQSRAFSGELALRDLQAVL